MSKIEIKVDKWHNKKDHLEFESNKEIYKIDIVDHRLIIEQIGWILK